MTHRYGVEVTKKNMALITFLNGGIPPEDLKERSWLVFEISSDGQAVEHQIVKTHRQFIRHEDTMANSPLFIRLKP